MINVSWMLTFRFSFSWSSTLYKLVSQTAFMSQLVRVLSFRLHFSLSLIIFPFFSLLVECVYSLFPDPLPQISFLSLGSQKVHPPSFLSLLPSLRSQKNGWLLGMHSFCTGQPPPLLLTVCLSVSLSIQQENPNSQTVFCAVLNVFPLCT